MTDRLHPPVHESYQRHRSQRTWQIILPVVLAALLLIALIVLINIATFRDNGDVARWAAISTIWISIPIMIASFILFILLAGIIFLFARLLQLTPRYTRRVQDFAYNLSRNIKRAADAAVKPVMFLNGIAATIQALLGRR